MVEVTEKAAAKIKGLVESERKDPAATGLRIGLKGGGCAGYQFVMALDEPKGEDLVYQKDGARVIVDAKSHIFLDGSLVDFSEGLQGAGFVVKSPKSTGSCGCGVSVSF